MSVSEEEIIKRKLLIEGSGGSDEKKIHGLVKTFSKWCMSDVSAEESQATYQIIMDTLLHCQLSCCKFQQVFVSSAVEQDNYERLNDRIADEIQVTEEAILESKVELETALIVRRYKEEYDALAKIIDQHPERQQLLSELEAIDEELLKSQALKKQYDLKLEERRKQFQVLVTSLHELQCLINADDAASNEDSQDEDMDLT